MNQTPTAAFFPRLMPAEDQRSGDVAALRSLTSAMARGDDDAWQQFHRTYGPAIFRQLLALTRADHDLAQEALQRTYLRVAKHVRSCENEPMFRAWLRTVARSALQDCWRRQRSFADLVFRRRQEPSELAEAAGDDHLLDRLDAALARIDPADRELLEAKYFTGLDVRSLAERLTITPKAVESRLTRARAALRHELLARLRDHE